MGETIRIEIPVSVNDNTDPGLSNITNKMNTLATAAQKVNRILSSGFKTRGIEQTAERVVERLDVSTLLKFQQMTMPLRFFQESKMQLKE